VVFFYCSSHNKIRVVWTKFDIYVFITTIELLRTLLTVIVHCQRWSACLVSSIAIDVVFRIPSQK